MKTRLASAADRVKCIIEMAMALAQDQRRTQYSTGIEFSLAELVREEMRTRARFQRSPGSPEDLLRVSIDHVVAGIETALEMHEVKVNLSKYINKVRERLTYPAREIQSLADKLVESKNARRLGAQEEMALDSGRHFVVHELGLRESIHGLLVEPTDECEEINLNSLREESRWQVKGDRQV